jgi:hypothetical protein
MPIACMQNGSLVTSSPTSMSRFLGYSDVIELGDYVVLYAVRTATGSFDQDRAETM